MEWTSEMTYWNNQKLKAEKKKKEYEEYKKELENLKGELPNAKDDISLSEKYLLDGGFCFDYGGTLGNGMFQVLCDKIETCISNLGNIISKTEQKIKELEEEIKNCITNFNAAVVARDRAKNVEFKAAP